LAGRKKFALCERKVFAITKSFTITGQSPVNSGERTVRLVRLRAPMRGLLAERWWRNSVLLCECASSHWMG